MFVLVRDKPANMLYSEHLTRKMKDTVSKIFAVLSLVLCLTNAAASDESYVIRAGDTVTVSVYNEPDLGVTSAVDSSGTISVPLLRTVEIAGLSVRNAEDKLEKLFTEQEILVRPQVTVSIAGYALKQVHVFGEVRSPGPKVFPNNVTNMDILEVISLAGDFTDLARTGSVKITRTSEDGSESTFILDVSKIRSGGKRSEAEMERYRIYPGDVIYVPERRW